MRRKCRLIRCFMVSAVGHAIGHPLVGREQQVATELVVTSKEAITVHPNRL